MKAFRFQQPTARWVILAGLCFSLLNVAFIVTENFWGLLIPFALALVAAIVFAMDKVLLFLIFSTPLSIFYFNEEMRLGFTLPTEPILFGVMLLFFAKILYRGHFDLKVVRHPLSLAILFHLVWMFFTSFTSELPVVSFKMLLARLWFVSVFFYLMSQLFKRRKHIDLFFWLYLIPLCGVVIYTLYIHAQHGFDKDAAGWVMFPFFKEHTSYGAVLAMYIPIAFAFTFFYYKKLNGRAASFVVLAILLAGVIFSFTRAAWLSLAVAVVAMVLIVLKTRFWVLCLLAAAGIGALAYAWDDIEKRLQKNEAVSSDNLTEHVESISNISTDPSNLERINRWKSALRMFAEKPVLGHGPGTYMFLYAPYQKPYEKTIISTNAGDSGNAHSEYIGPLAESGVLGMLSIVLIVVASVFTGIRAYYTLADPKLKLIALAALMGLITYWTHGFLNNFLEMDKAACPVWGFSALLVVLETYYQKTFDKSIS